MKTVNGKFSSKTFSKALKEMGIEKEKIDSFFPDMKYISMVGKGKFMSEAQFCRICKDVAAHLYPDKEGDEQLQLFIDDMKALPVAKKSKDSAVVGRLTDPENFTGQYKEKIKKDKDGNYVAKATEETKKKVDAQDKGIRAGAGKDDVKDIQDTLRSDG